MRWLDSVIKTVVTGPPSMVSSSLPILRSDNAHMLRSEPANCALP
jgi:hypothetical protein